MFEKGQALSAYPVKLIYFAIPAEEKQEVKAMFVVPKKKFKRANDRNKLKRRMRESYRLQKAEFYKTAGTKKLNLAFLYYGAKSEEYASISKAMVKLLNNLTKQIGALST